MCSNNFDVVQGLGKADRSWLVFKIDNGYGNVEIKNQISLAKSLQIDAITEAEWKQFYLDYKGGKKGLDGNDWERFHIRFGCNVYFKDANTDAKDQLISESEFLAAVGVKNLGTSPYSNLMLRGTNHEDFSKLFTDNSKRGDNKDLEEIVSKNDKYGDIYADAYDIMHRDWFIQSQMKPAMEVVDKYLDEVFATRPGLAKNEYDIVDFSLSDKCPDEDNDGLISRQELAKYMYGHIIDRIRDRVPDNVLAWRKQVEKTPVPSDCSFTSMGCRNPQLYDLETQWIKEHTKQPAKPIRKRN